MNKMREAFEQWSRNDKRNFVLTTGGICPDRYISGHTRDAERDRNDAWQAAVCHYQPLLDAKDAEIAELREELDELNSQLNNASTIYGSVCKSNDSLEEQNTALKALLEQTREGLEIGIGDILYLANETKQLDRFQETINQLSRSLAAISAISKE